MSVVGTWNEQTEEAVEADAITMFKRHLGRYMNSRGLRLYGPNAGKPQPR